MQGAMFLAAALISALPAFFFAWVALRRRDEDSYEDRLEREIAENKDELDRCHQKITELHHKLEDAQEENIRLMRKLLSNGSP